MAFCAYDVAPKELAHPVEENTRSRSHVAHEVVMGFDWRATCGLQIAVIDLHR